MRDVSSSSCEGAPAIVRRRFKDVLRTAAKVYRCQQSYFLRTTASVVAHRYLR